MNRFRVGKDRTILLRAIADGDDVIEALPLKFLNILRSLLADIDTDFIHDFNRSRMRTFRCRSYAKYIVGITGEMANKAFGHLAAGRVAGA